MTIRVKGWAKFQHFKDRRPPWIKLYRDILDDIEWHELDPVAAKCLTMIWLIASEDDGSLPDVRKLSFRLRMSETETREVIFKLSHWLERDDIDPISVGYQKPSSVTQVIDSANDNSAISAEYQSDLPETETETETEKRQRRGKEETKAAQSRDVSRPADVSESVWGDYLKLRKAKRAPVTATVLEAIRREAVKASMTLEAALAMCCAKGWQGFEAEWVKQATKPKLSQSSPHAFYGKPI